MKVIVEGTEEVLKKALSVIKGFKVTFTDEVGEPFFKKITPPPAPVEKKKKDKKGNKGKKVGSPTPEESELTEVNEENKTEQ